jgi:aryl-alcohol dehydrogenase-like predicted oxidoreductase/phosphoglycolate phosphatase-like HAD superfamily hydrolase
MRLSTDKARDDARSLAVLTAALAAGIDLLDTADCYAHDDRDVGHNETLVATAIVHAAKRPTIVTKGGLVRPDGAWVPNGRARHLAEAARASRDRLGAIDLYLLHAVDPKVPLATSVRALARLRDDGVVRGIGLSNVGVNQLEQALAVTSIDAVEIELSPWHLDAFRGGLLAACKQRGIQVLAHRPFGGPLGIKRIARDELLGHLATKQGATPYELVLAWLRRFGVVPLPGATRVETARSAARVLDLDEDSAEQLDRHFVAISEQPRVVVEAGEREVVMIVGMPAAGKTTVALDYAQRGYVRLNRDERGGSLLELARVLDRELAAGAARIVIDNTYGTRASRAPIVEVARRHDVPVRCLVASTSLEQAQANAVARMLDLHGRLLEPGEMRTTATIAPSVQFRYRRDYEPPRADEGFAAIEELAFAPRATAGKPALVIELDDIVWIGRPIHAHQLELRPGVREALARWHEAGYVLAGTTWLTSPALDDVLPEVLGVPIAIARCRHPSGPPVCWCRKPLPGLALLLARTHELDLARSIHVGKGPADRGFAVRAGLRYLDVADGFPMPANNAS